MTATPSRDLTRRTASARVPWLLVAAVVIAVAGLVLYSLVCADGVYASTGDSYPGTLTAVAERAGYFLAALAGALVFGGLLFVVIAARPDEHGVVDEWTFLAHVRLERAATAWTVVSMAMVVVQAASDAGTSVARLVASPAVVEAVLASEMGRAWIVVTLTAAIVAVSSRLTVRWVPHVVLLVPAVIGVIAVPVSGNAGQGPDHDYGTSAMIVLAAAVAAWVGIKVHAAAAPQRDTLDRRLLLAETLCGGLILGYGALLLTVLLGPGNPLRHAYGTAGLAVATLVAITWMGDVAALVRNRRGPRVPERLRRGAGAVAGVASLALIASMATQPAPRFLTHQFTTWDIFLGYELPRPPGVWTLASVWRFDTFIGVGALALAALYTLGYVRLRRRGDAWPVGRLVAWLAGCLVLLVTSSSGVKAYGSAMFSVHMAEHMTLNMFVPVLLVLGGPVTLALRVLPAAGKDRPPGPREWLLWLIHSKVTSALSHPATAFVLFVASLYAVYFTPIFDTLVRYHWGHELMSVHFLLVGYLFFWGIIGIDPGPRRLPFLGRLGLLFAVMPFHAFFGIATMTMTSTIGQQFYRLVDLPWLVSRGEDQHLGGAIAWGSSELPVILVVVALVAQWARQDRRAAVRTDRHAESDYADDELDAYNAMLRELAKNRR